MANTLIDDARILDGQFFGEEDGAPLALFGGFVSEAQTVEDLEFESTADETEFDRALRLRCLEIEYIYSPSFELPNIAETILAPMPTNSSEEKSRQPKARVPAGATPFLASLYRTPLLTPEQERHLFRKMNFLKYRASVLQKEIDLERPLTSVLDRIEKKLNVALAIRNQIVRANLRLVVSIAKKLVDRVNSFDDLVSDGLPPLIRSVEIFDFERGNRFSTYATWAVRNTLYRAVPKNQRRSRRFVLGCEPVFDSLDDTRNTARSQEEYHLGVREDLDRLISQLDTRDQYIVRSRFGLNESGKPHKFREIAEELDISTERVRQLMIRSLDRMRESAEQQSLDIEDFFVE